MEGFGVHTSMWTMNWDRAGAEKAIAGAVHYKMDFIEIALLNAPAVDAKHTRDLLEKNELRAVCSLGLPEHAWASVRPDAAIEHLKVAIEKTAEMNAEALSGVIFGGIGERTGLPPTQGEYDNIAKVLDAAAKHARKYGVQLGVEAVNRYENHLINSAQQAVDMVERVGADNVFVHLDTYHMNIEEKGAANGILIARDHLKYIHLSESDRGTPGYGNIPWDAIYAALAAIGFKGGLAMESFINMPPEVAYGLAVWRPVARDMEEVMDKGLPFLRNKAEQYGLI
ncbi:sugar phosphate isomerase/epimerase family protein [Rhizobium leguminosarum]|uniref:Xylose isomerase domain protein TIM barrel n=1 Tax=Rhizobium leguminosarum bv. trifolii (strain WSM1325) TaxID=395491 RepID=C6B611_RHILS|nr:sugar phosphate isomerase/epimerase [Rhizobium leguminosarum]ACS59519.1 Xylose isomerase domain protein TIM barrel [Rhizobium leguminosarum bv. trifolii WSM1325]MBY2925243.1 sugar phosphate isomerase/epimerase [Rhizobium leguminosarum]MBY2932952.1 sugar phosphate isomerase/epimerase [Rhizobium leguminosarum]MBY2942625.1 sugar phosphate isomerase/epimerase [Rhizobium leguminosarum]MBY2948589.1 sugar phosphate isomerase/epimerase [Rhizobium leguminosarum]